MNHRLAFISSCVIGMLPIAVVAQIYQCFAEDQMMHFQDQPCDPLALHIKHAMPELYRFEPGVSSSLIQLQSQDSIEALKQAKKKAQIQKKEQIEIRKKARLKARAHKQGEQLAAQEKRRVARCERTIEKITQTQERLKMGCKVPHCLRLKEQLAQEKQMQERYCDGH